MSIVGDRPESGVRIVLERPREGGPPWVYGGEAQVPDGAFALSVTIDDAGTVVVTFGEPLGTSSDRAPEPDLAERVRLLVRTVYKQYKADGEPPARRIVRWRPS